MKKISLLCFACILLFAACQNESTPLSQSGATAPEKTAHTTINGLQMLTEDNPELQHGSLRLYPIEADAQTLAANARFANWKTLEEAMKTPGFHITERKQFGRNEDTWFNGLTVQNKTSDTVFIMSGDVVRGGNQDRVNEQDMAVMPASLRNFSVFCVEHGRSYYYDPSATPAEKEVGAFNDYYAVASPMVRHAVNGGDQSEVWNAVSKVTLANEANSQTSAYAALETDNAAKTKREDYLTFFKDKLATPSTVGVVAVLNGEVIGVEVFAHPDLFQRRFPALLHSYAVEAAVAENKTTTTNTISATRRFAQVATLSHPTSKNTASAGKFAFNGAWVHLYGK